MPDFELKVGLELEEDGLEGEEEEEEERPTGFRIKSFQNFIRKKVFFLERMKFKILKSKKSLK